jgi:hypothetical protein
MYYCNYCSFFLAKEISEYRDQNTHIGGGSHTGEYSEIHTKGYFCFGQWKSYCKRFHFDPLKCMYNVKRIGVWKYEAKMSRDWHPPTTGMRGI